MPDTKIDWLVMTGKRDCPAAELHDPAVEYGIPDHLTFSEWARQMSRTHRAVKCQSCGLYKVWEPRPAEWGAAGPS